MSSQQPPLVEPYVQSPLMPTPSIPSETDDISYDMSVRPLTGSTITPYFYLATGISHQVAQTLPSVRMFTDASDSSPRDEAEDIQHEKELQCTSCPDICLTAGCMTHVDALGATGVQYFCELDQNCRWASTTVRTRRSARIAHTKQVQDMIE